MQGFFWPDCRILFSTHPCGLPTPPARLALGAMLPFVNHPTSGRAAPIPDLPTLTPISPKPLFVATGQSQTSERGGVGAQLVGDQQFRHEALLLQQFADQLLQSLLQVGIDPDTAFS